MTDEVMHVAAASSVEYLPWLATMLQSVLDHHDRGSVVCHVLQAAGYSDDDRERLRSLAAAAGADLHVHPVDPGELSALPSLPRFGGRVVWARLWLSELLPDVPRVLYLDADTFVVADLWELWHTDLGDCPIGAVGNVVEPAMRGYQASLGLADPTDVLNSGVILFDLDRMRAEDAQAQLLDYARVHGESLTWADQDTLNVVFERRWHHLHPRWNVQNSLTDWNHWAVEVFGEGAVVDALADPRVVHFEGPHLRKPWHYLSTHARTDEYRAAMRRTPWRDVSLVDVTPATRFIHLLPRSRWVPAYLRLWRWRERGVS